MCEAKTKKQPLNYETNTNDPFCDFTSTSGALVW